MYCELGEGCGGLSNTGKVYFSFLVDYAAWSPFRGDSPNVQWREANVLAGLTGHGGLRPTYGDGRTDTDTDPVVDIPVVGAGQEESEIDVSLGAGYGGQIFAGIFGVSVSVAGVTRVRNDEVCGAITGCFQFGFGLFTGVSANTVGSVVTQPSESGGSESVGVFVSAGNGASTTGSVDVGTKGSLGGSRVGAGPGAGFALGLQFCRIRNACMGAPK